ncbi:MAG: hypothetical protein ACREBE_01265 [bacterium]
MFAVVFAGCVQSPPPESPISDPLERTVLSEQACKAQGGSVVGDIGDGATHRSDYVCASGAAPLGDIAPPEDGPIPVEGAVCCPR